MKTKEQIKQSVVDYLNKTSLHTFSHTDNLIFKLLKKNDKYYVFNDSLGEKYKIRAIDVDMYIINYDTNAKNAVKRHLFQNRKLTSIKTSKDIKQNINLILDKL